MPERSGEVPVGGAGVGDQWRAAVGREDDAAQCGGLRRVEDEGHVGVPVVDRAVLAVDGEHAGCFLDGGDRGVRGGQLTEVAGEPLLARVVQVDAAEHQRLVLVQRRSQAGHRVRVQVEVGPEAGHLGADARGDLAGLQRGADGGRGHDGFPSVVVLKEVSTNWLKFTWTGIRPLAVKAFATYCSEAMTAGVIGVATEESSAAAFVMTVSGRPLALAQTARGRTAPP